MDCNSTIALETIARTVIRRVQGSTSCTAIAVDANSRISQSDVGCVAPSLLSRMAMSILDDLVAVQQYSGGAYVVPDCDALAERTLEEMLGYILLNADNSNETVFNVFDPTTIDDLDCTRSCTEEGIPTREMILRSIVRVADSFWAFQVAYLGEDDALDCDDTEVPTEQLIRSALMPVGDGSYAWRLYQAA